MPRSRRKRSINRKYDDDLERQYQEEGERDSRDTAHTVAGAFHFIVGGCLWALALVILILAFQRSFPPPFVAAAVSQFAVITALFFADFFIARHEGETIHMVLCLFIPFYLLFFFIYNRERYAIPLIIYAVGVVAATICFMGSVYHRVHHPENYAQTPQVYSPAPVDPQPVNPNPPPIEPMPVQPMPVQPMPVQPMPINPTRRPETGEGGLVGHWTFDNVALDGTMPDSSPRSNTAQAWFAVPQRGVKNFGLGFDGDRRRGIELGKSRDFDFEPDWDFTVCGWFAAVDLVGTILVFNNPSDGPRSEIQLALTAGNIQATVRCDPLPNEPVQEVQITGPRVNDGLWHQVALTRKKGTVTLHVDGQPVAVAGQNVVLNGAITTTSRSLAGNAARVQGPDFSPRFVYRGALDEFRVYHRALGEGDLRLLIQRLKREP